MPDLPGNHPDPLPLLLVDMPIEIKEIPLNDLDRDFEVPAKPLTEEQYRRAVRALAVAMPDIPGRKNG